MPSRIKKISKDFLRIIYMCNNINILNTRGKTLSEHLDDIFVFL